MINFANKTELSINAIAETFSSLTTGVKVDGAQTVGAEVGDLSRLAYITAKAKVEINNQGNDPFDAEFSVLAGGVEVGKQTATIAAGRQWVIIPANLQAVGGATPITVKVEVVNAAASAGTVDLVSSLIVEHPVIIAVTGC